MTGPVNQLQLSLPLTKSQREPKSGLTRGRLVTILSDEVKPIKDKENLNIAKWSGLGLGIAVVAATITFVALGILFPAAFGLSLGIFAGISLAGLAIGFVASHFRYNDSAKLVKIAKDLQLGGQKEDQIALQTMQNLCGKIVDNDLIDRLWVHYDSNRYWPPFFYCHVTKNELNEAVVIADGNTYERKLIVKAIQEQHPRFQGNYLLIENRSLIGFITEYKKAGSYQNIKEQRQHIECPISQCLMKDPVITPEGHSFDRAEIEAWIDRHHDCPLTRTRLRKEQLVPNLALKGAIEQWKKSFPNAEQEEEVAPEYNRPAPPPSPNQVPPYNPFNQVNLPLMFQYPLRNPLV